ncbi:hypothetical protein Tco_1108295 [Tanacetum coccineum]
MPHDSPLLRVHTLGSDEGRMQHNELMDLVTKLSDRVVALETDLTQTKKVYGAAFTKLIKKVKRLEKKDKLSKSRRKLSLVLSDEKASDSDILAQEDSFKLGRKIAQIAEDEGITLLLGAAVTTASVAVSTARPTISTTDDITMAKSLVYIKRSASKEKGKGKMDESEPVQTKTKLQQRQERLGYEAALRLQEQLDEEESYTLQQLRGYSFDEIKSLFEATMKRVNTFTPMKSDVDKTVPKIAAESSKRDAEEELGQESSKRQNIGESPQQAKEPRDKEPDELSQEELQQMMIIVPEQMMNVEALQTKDDLVKLWSLVKERFTSTEPTFDKEREIWVELKRLFKPDIDDELWKLQKHIHDLTWKLYDSCECIICLQRRE